MTSRTPQTPDLVWDTGALDVLRNHVGTMRRQLDSSAASGARLSHAEVPRASFGGPFAEAEALFRRCAHTQARLTSLARTLTTHLEAYDIAVRAARDGFGAVEDDLRRRFQQLLGELRHPEDEPR